MIKRINEVGQRKKNTTERGVMIYGGCGWKASAPLSQYTPGFCLASLILPAPPFSPFLKPTVSPNVLGPRFPIIPLAAHVSFLPFAPLRPLLSNFKASPSSPLPLSLSLSSRTSTLPSAPSPAPSCDPPPPSLPVILLKPPVSISVCSHSSAPHMKADSRRVGTGCRRQTWV